MVLEASAAPLLLDAGQVLSTDGANVWNPGELGRGIGGSVKQAAWHHVEILGHRVSIESDPHSSPLFFAVFR